MWYLDGMTKKQLTLISDGYGELLYQDGLSAFAIGSLATEEELFVQKYKVLSLYSPRNGRFEALLEQFGAVPTAHLVTAWDTFSAEYRVCLAHGNRGPDGSGHDKGAAKIGMYKG